MSHKMKGVSCPVWAVAPPTLHNLPMIHPHVLTETNNINSKDWNNKSRAVWHSTI